MTTLDDVKKTMFRSFNSFERLGFVFEQIDNLSAVEWFKLLGCAWSTCDNIGLYGFEFGCSPFSETDNFPNPLRGMMDEVENKSYDAIGETITVYRGCYEGLNEDGFSWSIDKDVATSFIKNNRYHQNDFNSLVITATFSRDVVAAIKLNRNEFEIIIRPPFLDSFENVALSWDVEHLGGAV